MKESTIKMLENLNSDIKILNVYREGGGNNRKEILFLECAKCGYQWKVSYRQYKNNPTCSNCREKKEPVHLIKQKATTEEFINIAKKIHPEYDYSKVVYNGYLKPITVICPKHGEFQINAKAFLGSEYRCAKCKAEEKIVENCKKFIEKSKIVHGNKYDYSKINYIGDKINVCITCPEHGDFYQTPHNHTNGAACPKCANESRSKKKETFF